MPPPRGETPRQRAHVLFSLLLSGGIVLFQWTAPAFAMPVGAVEPRADLDGDGVDDSVDLCPAKIGLASDGCPPRDDDGDGLVNSLDACVAQPGPRAMRGCPDRDQDGDGVADRIDACPNQAGVPTWKGCLAPDLDRDGVPDDLDRCAASAERWNGRADSDGCADAGSALFEAVADGHELRAVLSITRSPPTKARWIALLRVAAAFAKSRRSSRIHIVIVPPQATSLGAALDLAAVWQRSLEITVASVSAFKNEVLVRTTYPGAPPGVFIGRVGKDLAVGPSPEHHPAATE